MKISELVKTYKLLNDPNAPDWNVKFIGGAILALGIIAAVGVGLYQMRGEELQAPATAAATIEGDGAPCTVDEIADAWLAYKAEHPAATSMPTGERLASGCIVQ